jgi:tryptophan synthase alpha chain
MTLISEIFATCKSEKRAALMPFLTAGFPDQELFGRLLETIIRAGSDMVEIGIPFSDPLADGRSIQFSSHAALAAGTNLKNTIQLLGSMNNNNRVPLIMMSYYNPIIAFGLSGLACRAHDAGIGGLIVPDIIPEEGVELDATCEKNGIDRIYLLAPTSTAKRRGLIFQKSTGFVYLVSVTGVTGARRHLPRGLHDWIRRIKKESPLPVCVGFGISDYRQAKKISEVADGIIIGSAIVEIIRNSSGSRKILYEVEKFISQLKERI